MEGLGNGSGNFGKGEWLEGGKKCKSVRNGERYNVKGKNCCIYGFLGIF